MTLSFQKTEGVTTSSFTETTILKNESGEDGKRSFNQVTANGGSHLSAVIKKAGTTA